MPRTKKRVQKRQRTRQKVAVESESDEEAVMPAEKPQATLEPSSSSSAAPPSQGLARPTQGVWQITLDSSGFWGQAHVAASGSYLKQSGSSKHQPLQIQGDGTESSPFRLGAAELVFSEPGLRVWQWPNGTKSTWTCETECQDDDAADAGSLQSCIPNSAVISPHSSVQVPKSRKRARPPASRQESLAESDAEESWDEQGSSSDSPYAEDESDESGAAPKASLKQKSRMHEQHRESIAATSSMAAVRARRVSHAERSDESDDPPQRRSRTGAGQAKPIVRRAQRAAAVRAMAAVRSQRGRAIGDSDAELSSEADGAEDLAKSDAESSDARPRRHGARAVTRRPQRGDLPDVLQDPEAESWQKDLEQRRTSALNSRSSFSSSSCTQRSIRALPESSFLTGRPIFDCEGRVNLHLLVAAYAQLADSPESCHHDTGARHILWLAEAARGLKLVSLDQLQRGKLTAKREQREDSSTAAIILGPDREVRFPARPLAGKRNGSKDGDEFFSDEEDAMEQFLRRKRAVMQLRSKANDRQAQIATQSSHGVDMAEMRKTLMAPTLSFDWASSAAQKNDDSEDEASGFKLEVCVPEDDPNHASRRGLFKDSIKRSISLKWAEGLKGETSSDNVIPKEEDAADEDDSVRIKRRKHVVHEQLDATFNSEGMTASTGSTAIPSSQETATCSLEHTSPNIQLQVPTWSTEGEDIMEGPLQLHADDRPNTAFSSQKTPLEAPAGTAETAPVVGTGFADMWKTLEGAFPSLRRLRRVSEDAHEHEDEEEDSDEEENEEEEDAEEDEVDMSEDEQETAISQELIRQRRKALRRKRREARRRDRKLRWELGDIAQIRNEVERMVLLGTATMAAEDQQRWQQVIDATFATPPSMSMPSADRQSVAAPTASNAAGGASATSVFPMAGGQLSKPSSSKIKPLFSGRGEDDGGDIYSLAGTASTGVKASFLKLAPARSRN